MKTCLSRQVSCLLGKRGSSTEGPMACRSTFEAEMGRDLTHLERNLYIIIVMIRNNGRYIIFPDGDKLFILLERPAHFTFCLRNRD